MGFWIFMLIMNIMIPLTMIGFGRIFIKNAPKNINYVFGYRTTMSMKNKDTWEFAHKYCGKLWYRCGMILMILSAVVMLVIIGQSEEVIGTVGAILCTIEMIPLIGCIVPTEIALRKNFDKDGKCREVKNI